MAKREKKEKGHRYLLLDQIKLKGHTQEAVLGQEGLVKYLRGRLLQRVMEPEMDGHVSEEKQAHEGTIQGTG